MTSDAGTRARHTADEHHDLIVVGAGFSGLYMLHRARNVLGLDTVVFEAGDGVGGTWYWNRYPGARCDSESWYYCYTFDEALAQEWTWTTKYPEQPEIRAYLEHVADRFDLRRDIRLGTTVTEARFDDHDAHWVVTTADGTRVRAPYLVSAVGCLSAANVPQIPGLERFGATGTTQGAGRTRASTSRTSGSASSAPGRQGSRRRP